mmetsp:Transcript_6920/g.28339  ORF Transcript_6920/g.28339 Transcript_6920/m.28339 type:complete len:502 (-) Transcript_6920:721-2226(-)
MQSHAQEEDAAGPSCTRRRRPAKGLSGIEAMRGRRRQGGGGQLKGPGDGGSAEVKPCDAHARVDRLERVAVEDDHLRGRAQGRLVGVKIDSRVVRTRCRRGDAGIHAVGLEAVPVIEEAAQGRPRRVGLPEEEGGVPAVHVGQVAFGERLVLLVRCHLRVGRPRRPVGWGAVGVHEAVVVSPVPVPAPGKVIVERPALGDATRGVREANRGSLRSQHPLEAVVWRYGTRARLRVEAHDQALRALAEASVALEVDLGRVQPVRPVLRDERVRGVVLALVATQRAAVHARGDEGALRRVELGDGLAEARLDVRRRAQTARVQLVPPAVEEEGRVAPEAPHHVAGVDEVRFVIERPAVVARPAAVVVAAHPELLVHQQAQPVGAVVERLRLGHASTPHAHGVEPGVAVQAQLVAVALLAGAVAPHGVRRNPVASQDEEAAPVDQHELREVAGGVGRVGTVAQLGGAHAEAHELVVRDHERVAVRRVTVPCARGCVHEHGEGRTV